MKNKSRNASPLSLFAFQDIITSVTGVFLLVVLLIAVELTTRQKISPQVISPPMADQLLEPQITEAETKRDDLRSTVKSRTSQALKVSGFNQASADMAITTVLEEIRLLTDDLTELKNRQDAMNQQEAHTNQAIENRTPDQNRLTELEHTRTTLENELAELKSSQQVFYNAVDGQGRQVLLVELFDNAILVAEAGQETVPHRFSGQRLQAGLLDGSGEQYFLDWAKQQSKAEVTFMIIVHPGTTSNFSKLHQKLRELGFSIGFDLLPSDKIAINSQSGAS